MKRVSFALLEQDLHHEGFCSLLRAMSQGQSEDLGLKSLADPELSALTTIMLSENTCTVVDLQERPHTAMVITTGTIFSLLCGAGSRTWAIEPAITRVCDKEPKSP